MTNLDTHSCFFTPETRERKHADLVRNMVPGTWRLNGNQAIHECLAHIQDPILHVLEVLLPLTVQSWIFQDDRDNTGTVS